MKEKKRIKWTGFLLLLVLLAMPMQAYAAKASIKLNASKKTLTVGSTATLKATVKGKSKKVTWKSSNKAIATVSSKGKITAKKAGKTTITAKANGKTARCVVTVKKANSYKTVYEAFLAQHPPISNWASYGAGYYPSNKSYVNNFFLYDVDKNGTPELITSTYIGYSYTIMRMYTVKSGKVKKLTDWTLYSGAGGHYYFYICKKRHFHTQYQGEYYFISVNDRPECDTAYKYANGKLTVYLERDYKYTAVNTVTYKCNGSKITAAKYKKLVSGCKEISLKRYDNTSANRKKLQKGKCTVSK